MAPHHIYESTTGPHRRQGSTDTNGVCSPSDLENDSDCMENLSLEDSSSTESFISPDDDPVEESPHRFLLVEDNPVNMKILQAYMKKLGQPYDAATDGLQALDAYRKCNGRYRCILMDISMPVMDGFESASEIRAFEREKKLDRCNIFALTGLASKDAQDEAFSIGIDLFLSKPVKLKDLSMILTERNIL